MWKYLNKDCNCNTTPTNPGVVCNHDGLKANELIYRGLDVACSGIYNGMTVAEVLQQIDYYLCSLEFTQQVLDIIQDNPQEFNDFITLVNGAINCETITSCGNPPSTTTTTSTSSTTSTTTSTTTLFPPECIEVKINFGTNCPGQSYAILGYTDCNGVEQEVEVGAGDLPIFCVLNNPYPSFVCGDGTIDIIGNCDPITTTTTTTIEPTTTTTTTSSCNCVDIVISQDDIDDATGNTMAFLNGTVLLWPEKDASCEGQLAGQDPPAYFSVAGTYTYCLKASAVPTLELTYVKDNNTVTVIQSEIVNLGTPCLVNGECSPTTTTTTTADISCTEVGIDAGTVCPGEEYATVEYTDCEGNVQTIQASPGDLSIVCMLNSSTPVYLCGDGGFQYGEVCFSTTTTTSTTSGSMLAFATISSTSNVTDACGEALDTPCWVSNVGGFVGSETVTISSVIYTDSGGTIPFLGNGEFYHIQIDLSSTSASCEIDSTGNVISAVALCF